LFNIGWVAIVPERFEFDTLPFCFGIFAEAIPFRDKSEKNGGIRTA